jgi:hypothetical protein
MSLAENLKLTMNVELLDPISRIPCALGHICGVVGMSFHHAPIALGTCTVVVTTIKKLSTKLPFPKSIHSKTMRHGE